MDVAKVREYTRTLELYERRKGQLSKPEAELFRRINEELDGERPALAPVEPRPLYERGLYLGVTCGPSKALKRLA